LWSINKSANDEIATTTFMNQPPRPPPLTRQYTLTPYQIKCVKRKRTVEIDPPTDPPTDIETDKEESS